MERKSYRAYLIDLDGTLYFGKKRIRTAETFIHTLLDKKIPFLILTNNATRTAKMVAQDLQDNYHLPVKEEHIYNSAMAMVDILKRDYPKKKVHVIGEPAFKDFLDKSGIKLVSAQEGEILVQALDRQITYEGLAQAANILRRGSHFLVTNQDRSIPTQEGMIPSSGALTAFLSYTTGVEPIVVGKPNWPILEGALKHLKLDKEEVLIVGDNYETDIQLGLKHGVDSLLVLTGVTKQADLANFPQAPTYVCRDLSEWQVDK